MQYINYRENRRRGTADFPWNIITSLLPIRSMSCPFTGM